MENIYKWEKGTKPSDPNEYRRLIDWLEGKLEAIPNAAEGREPTAMQILDRLTQAFADQAKALSDQAEGFKSQAAAFKAQGELMGIIRNEMARESTLARMEPNLKRTLAASLTAVKNQEDAMKELRNLLPPAQKKGLSRDGGKGQDQIGGGSEKKGMTPA